MEEECTYTFIRRFDLSFPSVIFIWRYQTFGSVIFISHLYLSYYVIVFCHFIVSLSLLPSFLSFTNVIILCRLLLSCSSVILFCHLHLAFWICHLQSFSPIRLCLQGFFIGSQVLGWLVRGFGGPGFPKEPSRNPPEPGSPGLQGAFSCPQNAFGALSCQKICWRS